VAAGKAAGTVGAAVLLISALNAWRKDQRNGGNDRHSAF
jgi:hypothetical protein